VNNREDNFKEALKTLVAGEPEKLAFFDGSGKAAIPPFVQRDTTEDRRKTVSFKRQRRGYMFGMVAAAACCIVFVSAAALNYGPESFGPTATDGSESAAQIVPEASEPAEDDFDEADGDYDESLRQGVDTGGENEGAATDGVGEAEIAATGPAGENEDAAADAGLAENSDESARESAALPFSLLIIGAIIFAAVFLVLFIKRRKLS